jgi:ABC-type amino acid transport substrate-binding protein
MQKILVVLVLTIVTCMTYAARDTSLQSAINEALITLESNGKLAQLYANQNLTNTVYSDAINLCKEGTKAWPDRSGVLDQVLNRGEIVIGYDNTADYPPFYYTEFKGLEPELITAVVSTIKDHYGVSQLDIVRYPVTISDYSNFFVTVNAYVQNGTVDVMIATIGILQERSNITLYSCPYNNDRPAAMRTKKDPTLQITNINQANITNPVVSIVGFKNSVELLDAAELLPFANITEISDQTVVNAEIFKDNYDLVIGSVGLFEQIKSQNSAKCVGRCAYFGYGEPSYVGMLVREKTTSVIPAPSGVASLRFTWSGLLVIALAVMYSL